jgi:glycine/D-amino acid oxidase-like deaminating enzyme
MSRVVVYIATGCHLCPPAVAAAQAACAARAIVPEIVDLDGVLALEHRYRERIPVVVIDDREVGYHFVTEAEIAAVLDLTHS